MFSYRIAGFFFVRLNFRSAQKIWIFVSLIFISCACTLCGKIFVLSSKRTKRTNFRTDGEKTLYGIRFHIFFNCAFIISFSTVSQASGYLQHVLDELEEKTPALQQLRRNYDTAMKNCDQLTTQLTTTVEVSTLVEPPIRDPLR